VTLRELQRVTSAGGRHRTALWAPIVLDERDQLAAGLRAHDGSLALPRAMTLVTATV
jgi:hypothetical protein